MSDEAGSQDQPPEKPSEEPEESRRGADRAAVKIPVQLRQRTSNFFNADMADLSPGGFCLFYTGKLDMDAPIMLRIESFAPMTAHLRWHRGDEYGCQFVNPLYQGVFEHIVQHLSDQGYKNL